MPTRPRSRETEQEHVSRAHALSDRLHERERSRIEAWRERWVRVRASAAGEYWTRLSATDFMTSSFAFAALGVLCAYPFLAVVSAATGGDLREVIVVRMGLNRQAAEDVNAFISSETHAVATLSVFSAAFLLVGALGMAATLQAWYQKIYDQPKPSVVKRVVFQIAGVIAFSVYISVNVVVLNAVKPYGGHALMLVVQFVLSTLYWWCAAYFILYCKISARTLFPAGLATGAFITGLGAFSWFLFSGMITSGEKTYGHAGVALAIISYLVGFGVCLHLGAVFGRMWNDWHAAGRAELEAGAGELLVAAEADSGL